MKINFKFDQACSLLFFNKYYQHKLRLMLLLRMLSVVFWRNVVWDPGTRLEMRCTASSNTTLACSHFLSPLSLLLFFLLTLCSYFRSTNLSVKLISFCLPNCSTHTPVVYRFVLLINHSCNPESSSPKQAQHPL